MLFISLLRWWYGFGWADQVALVRERLNKVADFFSIGLSIRTLFKPFKQIDADKSRKGSINQLMQAAFDQFFSRFVGVMVRTVLIVAGVITLLVEALIGLFRLVVWPLLPALPVLMLPLVLSGWVPWQ